MDALNGALNGALTWVMQWGMRWITTPSTVVASAFAVAISILFLRARQHYLAIPVLPAFPPGESRPDCMVVIPARNEEGVVGDAVRSLPPDTVIVVDDYSTDRTAGEAREAGAGVLEEPTAVRGALGKAYACAAGARILNSRWILFADADTRYQEGFLESVVHCAEDSGVALLSVHLTPRAGSLAERLLEPYTTALFFSGASLERDSEALFTGQCILARREAYEFIGGHAAVWKFLAEDVRLALLARRHRMEFAIVRSANLGSARSYTGWKGAWSGIQRNAFRFIQVRPGTASIILLTALCTALWLPAAAWLWFDDQRVAAGVLVFLVLLQLRPWYGNRWRLLLAPLVVYAALPLVLNGALSALTNRPIRWKGRRVKAT